MRGCRPGVEPVVEALHVAIGLSVSPVCDGSVRRSGCRHGCISGVSPVRRTAATWLTNTLGRPFRECCIREGDRDQPQQTNEAELAKKAPRTLHVSLPALESLLKNFLD